MRTGRQTWNIPPKGGEVERACEGDRLEDAHTWCLTGVGGGRFCPSAAMK